MEAVGVKQYAIECLESGKWREWYSSADRAEIDDLWARVRLVEPRVPIRLVEQEIIRSSETEGELTRPA